MAGTDPASLSKLNPIIWPEPAPWWPPAPGWYLVLTVLAMLLAWTAWHMARRWWRNRYRRAALRELNAIKADPSAIGALPGLLKRTAMVAFRRERAAALNGVEWQAFLDRTNPRDSFDHACGELLARLSYRPDAALSPDESANLLRAGESWLRHHRTEVAS